MYRCVVADTPSLCAGPGRGRREANGDPGCAAAQSGHHSQGLPPPAPALALTLSGLSQARLKEVQDCLGQQLNMAIINRARQAHAQQQGASSTPARSLSGAMPLGQRQMQSPPVGEPAAKRARTEASPAALERRLR